MPLPNRDMTDWDQVKRQIAEDAPIPYDSNDPDDAPYDPDDDEAVERFLTNANRVSPLAPERKRIREGILTVPS